MDVLVIKNVLLYEMSQKQFWFIATCLIFLVLAIISISHDNMIFQNTSLQRCLKVLN